MARLELSSSNRKTEIRASIHLAIILSVTVSETLSAIRPNAVNLQMEKCDVACNCIVTSGVKRNKF